MKRDNKFQINFWTSDGGGRHNQHAGVLQLPTHLRMQMKAIFPLPLHKKVVFQMKGDQDKSLKLQDKTKWNDERSQKYFI